MPQYHYACECGNRFHRVLPVASCRKKVRCPGCHRAAPRDFVTEHGGTAHHAGNWPMYSDAVGVLPSQIKQAVAAAKRRGVPTNFTPDGRVIFTGPAHRKRYCESLGVYDRNGGYGDPQSGKCKE